MDERANRGDAPAHVAVKIADSDDLIESLKKVRKVLPPTHERCGGCGPIEQCTILKSLEDALWSSHDAYH